MPAISCAAVAFSLVWYRAAGQVVANAQTSASKAVTSNWLEATRLRWGLGSRLRRASRSAALRSSGQQAR